MEIEKYSPKWLLKNILESGNQHGRALMFIVEFQNHLMSVGENEFYTLLCAARDMLTNLKRCGDFYFSAIELDRYIDNPIGGEDLEKDIDKLLEMINERCV